MGAALLQLAREPGALARMILDLVRAVRQYAEEGRVAIRNIRREALDKLKKLAKELHLSEDETKRAEAEIQKITDEFIAKADQLAEKKEQEILG